MPSDEGYSCGDPLEGDVSQQYLDCLCGAGNWQGNCGAGQEQGLEAGFMALCRAVENPPEDCYIFSENAALAFEEGDELSNGGLLREGASTLIVIVTDEGDGSLRTDTDEAAFAGDVENVVDGYADLFAEFENPVRFAVIGPAWDGSDGSCLGSAVGSSWGVERYQGIVEATNGLYIPLTGMDPACTPTDFGTSLEQLGDLLSNLMTIFPLQSVPDVASIEVFVDGDTMERAPIESGSEEAGNAEYGPGWTYDASENAVRFHSTAVPDYNQDVRIYYRPLGGTPRELPF